MIVRTQTVRFTPDRAPTPRKIRIGFEGDNMVERLCFKLPRIAENQTATMMLDGEYANMVILTEDEDRYYVDLTAELIGGDGEHEAYVVIDGGDTGETWGSGTFTLQVGEIPGFAGEIADRVPDAIEQLRSEIAGHLAEMEETSEEIKAEADAARADAEVAQKAANDAAESSGDAKSWARIAEAEASDAERHAKRAEQYRGDVYEVLKGGDDGQVLGNVNGEPTWIDPPESGGGDVTTDALNAVIAQHNASGGAHPDIRAMIGASGGGTGGGVASVNGKTGAVVLTAADVGALAEDELQGAVNDALAQAKESGEFDGSDGVNGKDGKNGVDGSPGKDGVSVTHNWNGTTLTVTSASGTSSADLKGSKGDKGDKGDTGSVGLQGEKGETGATGPAGANGKTPVKGVDYYTDADKAEWSEYIAAELAKRGQLRPEFAGSIEECTDTSKLYVLPDGYIYAYILTEVTAPDQPQYTNVLPAAIDSSKAVFNGTGYKNGYRLNSSATEKQQSGCGYTGFIKITPNSNNTIRMKNLVPCAEGYHYVHGFDSSFVRQGQALQTASMLAVGDDGVITFAVNANWEYIRISNGEMNANTIITVNEEIKVIPGGTTTEYAWTNTGHAFVPADYEGRIVILENKTDENAERLDSLEAEQRKQSGIVTMFISPDGSDANSGLSADAPKKTVKSCVGAGATRISAKRGVYAEAVDLRNIGDLEIFPTDNAKTYVVGETRQSIVFDTSHSVNVLALSAYNSIKRVAYSNAANEAYKQVFVDKTLAPTVSASQSSYHATLWLFSDDEKTVCRKLKPVLTVAECEAEVGTFCYSGGYIYINADLAGVTKILIPTISATGFCVNGADRLALRDVEVRFSGEYAFDLRGCAWVDLHRCSSKFTTRASGFHPVDTDGIFRACYATKCFDGFAPNGHGHTTYIDCVSENNYDDGMSHHSSTEGTVIGGRYEGNGKGGNTPAYGAKVNIYGGLYKNNAQWGIGYVGSSDSGYASGMVQGAIMVDNPVGLLVQEGCVLTVVSCKYVDNVADKDVNGVLAEY